MVEIFNVNPNLFFVFVVAFVTFSIGYAWYIFKSNLNPHHNVWAAVGGVGGTLLFVVIPFYWIDGVWFGIHYKIALTMFGIALLPQVFFQRALYQKDEEKASILSIMSEVEDE